MHEAELAFDTDRPGGRRSLRAIWIEKLPYSHT